VAAFRKSPGIGGVSGELHDTKALASGATAALDLANAKLDGALDQIRQLRALQRVLEISVEELQDGRTATPARAPEGGTIGADERPAP